MERKQESALGRAIKRSLDMKWGFREIRLIQGGTGWSKEAQALIDKYDELLALHDRIKPRVEQKSLELKTRFDDLEAKMRSLENARITNTTKARADHQALVEAQIKVAETLEADVLVGGKALLADKNALKARLDELPATQGAIDEIEAIEDALVHGADDAFKRGKAPHIGLTVESHEVFFKKKTEVLEDMVADTVAKSSNPKLAELKKLPKDAYWKILIDGKAHDAGNKHAYDRSKGYMASMMKGLNKIVTEIDKPLSAEFVKGLHSCATQHVTNETRIEGAITNNIFQEQGLKKAPNGWGVCKDHSPAGLAELKAIRNELDLLVPPSGYFSDDTVQELQGVKVPTFKAGKTPENLAATVEQLMTHVIDKCATELKSADAEDKKIGAIIDCCRSLGQIHPFKDANGRLVMFLILNKLLIENAMPPTILQDQGHMVGKSKDELIALIKAGQGQVRKMYND